MIERPFDDGRWPDPVGKADCFLCGKKVDPKDPLRGSYEIAPAGAALPIHITCLNNRPMIQVEIAYRAALNEAVEHPLLTH